MTDTTPTPADRPADQLRAAAEKLRAARFSGAITATPTVAALIGARLPLAAWLESWAGVDLSEHGPMPEDAQHALAVARQILGTEGEGAAAEPSAERRARYEDALWVHALNVAAAATAVMAVADAEQASLRAEAEGLDEALRGTISASEKDGARLRAELAAAVPPAPADPFSYEERERTGRNGGLAVRADAPPAPADRAATCICGHPEQQHFEDVCQTCDCADFLVPEAAREMIAHLHRAVIAKQDGLRAAVLREVEAKVRTVVAELWGDGITQTQLDRAGGAQAVQWEIRRLADDAAAGVQPPTSEAHPPYPHTTTWTVEGQKPGDNDWVEWGDHYTVEAAQAQAATFRDIRPDHAIRVLRQDVAHTVEPEPAAPAEPEEPK